MLLNRVFVTGAYGVGKSTLCKLIAQKSKFSHLKASELIYSYLKQTPPRNKQVSDVQYNQKILIQAFAMQKELHPNCLLEGHMCLLDKNNEIQKIPFNVFKELELTAIVIVTRNVVSVRKGLLERDQIVYDQKRLEKIQCLELVRAKEFSQKEKIPFLQIDLDKMTLYEASESSLKFLRHACQTPIISV